MNGKEKTSGVFIIVLIRNLHLYAFNKTIDMIASFLLSKIRFASDNRIENCTMLLIRAGSSQGVVAEAVIAKNCFLL